MKTNLLGYKYVYSFMLCVTMLFSYSISWGQGTEIFNEQGGGIEPSGWIFVNQVTSNDIDRGSYWLVDAGNPGDEIITKSYDLSGYSSAEFQLQVASFGSGTHNTAKIEISYDGGVSYTQIENSALTTGSSYINGGIFSLSMVSNSVVIKISNSGNSGRGVRLRNLVLTAAAPTVGPQITNITTTPAGGITSSDAVTVSADVTDAAGIANVALKWGTTSGSLSNSLAMTNTTVDAYEAIIPAQADGTMVYYALEAENTTGDTNTSTEMSYTVEDPVVVNLPYTVDATTVNPFTDGWTTQDLAGGNSWQYNTGSGVSMNAYSNNCDAEDWLITPAFDLSTTANELLSFELYENFSGTSIDVLYSTNYDGVSDPNTATWTNITTIQTGNSGVITDNISLQGLSANKVYVAFLYEGTGGSCSDWELTNFSLEEGVTTPTILTSTASLTGLNYMDTDGPSAAQSFDLSGSLLDGTQDVSIETMMGDFEVSLDDVAYADSLTLTNYDGTTTPVYVRLKAGHPQGMYADSVLINGYSLTEIEVSLEGEVTPFSEEYAGIGVFELISSNAELTDGYYVITNENSEYLMTNINTGYFTHEGVTVSNNKIEDPIADNVWYIEANGGGYTIYNEVTQKYVGWSSGNSASEDITVTDNARWTFDYQSGKFTVNNLSTPERQLSYNSGAPRFAAYGNSGQQELQLYKIVESPTADYTYTSGSWSPIDPNGMALPTDNIEVLDGTATFNNAIEINNLSIATGATLEVKDVLTVNGNITNDGNIIFKSTAIKTAQLDEFNGTITGSGDVTVERYIPARRAFRMLSTAVSGQTIANAWQQNTHITGDQAGNNGFDATATGNPSMFTFDNQYTAAPWAAIANTDNTTLTAGKAYRLMVRGDRTVDLTNNATPATVTTLVSTGDLHTGTYNDANLNTVAGKFNFVGNPYQAVVDMNSVLPTSTNLNTNNYVVWDPSLATRGAYVTIDLATGTNSSGSAANQYLQPGQAAFVTTAANGATEIAFNEVDKAVTNPQTSIFNMYTGDAQAITMQLYTQEQFTAGEAMSDSFRVNFVAGASNAVNLKDAQKFPNLDENIALVNNNAYLSLEYRNVPQANEVLPIFINNYRATAYVMNIEVGTFENVKAYLRDNYTQEETELATGNNQITFSLTDEASKDANRFEIYFAAVLGTDNFTSADVSLYPNPVNNGLFTVNTAHATQAELSLYSLLGQEVYHQDLTGTINTVDVSGLNAGTYIVKITSNKAVVTKKLIIK
ncbi:MAG: T9SS type A sorting domain-containing protein [Mesonia hippocampi]|uniref:T9SS type A sorting domain-containing protein n=1 Tax=Mesonia hippocampi TaxID=1628250 RepID=UPI003F979488